MSDSTEYITVCTLMRAHGVKGYIKAMPLTHDLTRHEKLSNVMLKKTNGEQVQLTLEDSRLANKLWLLKFEGYNTPESIAHFVNADLMIPKSERLDAPECEFYLDDLQGFCAKCENGCIVGSIIEVVELPTVNAFHIKFDKAFESEFSPKTVLAPWIDDCVLSIDEASKSVVFDADYLKSLCPEK